MDCDRVLMLFSSDLLSVADVLCVSVYARVTRHCVCCISFQMVCDTERVMWSMLADTTGQCKREQEERRAHDTL